MLSFELKKGIFKEKNILDIFSIYTFLPSSESSYTQDIAKKYGVFDRHTNPIDPQLWYDYFVNGAVDKELLKTSIYASVFYESENTPNWKKLKNIWTLESSDFNWLFMKVYEELREGNIKDKYVLLHIVDTLLFLSNENIINIYQDEIYNTALSAVDRMKVNGLLNHEISNSITIDRNLGVEYFNVENTLFKSLYKVLKEQIELSKTQAYKNEANYLISLLVQSVYKFEDALLINSFGASRFYEIPILCYVDVNSFLSVFWKLSSLDQRYVGSTFVKRYSYEDFNTKIQIEVEWLKEVNKLVSEQNNMNNDLLKKYLINNGFVKHLKSAIRKLEG